MSVRVRQLAASRGSFGLQIAQWQAESGEFHAVLGANGAGKSSFFAALSGDLAYRGHIDFYGRALREWPLRARARHIGVLPQQTQMSFAFTAAEVVALGLTPLSVNWRFGQRRVRELLATVDCSHLAERAYPSLSGGERQRINLARVLLQLSEAERAPLLLLDEPTSAQDLGQQHAVLALARDLAHDQSYTVVAILHDLNQALRYCDACVLLRQGEVVATGVPAEVLQPDTVAAEWGYRPERAQLREGVVLV